MKPEILEALLRQRPLAYVVTDHSLSVIAQDGDLALLPHGPVTLGCSLLDLAPELIGYEPTLQRLLAGEEQILLVPLVNRETDAGEIRYVSLHILPCRDDAGRITGLVHVIEDVTETGQVEQLLTQQRNELALLQAQLADRNLQLEAANAELLGLDEMKSMFLAVAAHELRTPLASILGFAELLLDDNDPAAWTPAQLQFLQIIQRNAGRLLEIANNLLDITRLAAGRMEIDLRPHDLGSLVEQLVAEFRPRAASRSQQLTPTVAAHLPPVLCDAARTAQVMGNLLDNAVKYTPEGGAIQIRLQRADEAGFLQLSVSDTGIGVSEADQAHLFDSFFRARNSNLTAASGAGLGLHIVRALVELHGGRVWVKSQPGAGSTFFVTFPISDD